MPVQVKGDIEVSAFFDRFERNTGITVVNAVKKHGMDLYRSVIYRSPVDTGAFRTAWGFNVATGGEHVVKFSIFNSLPYAGAIVTGSVVGQLPWPSEGPKTVQRKGRIWSAQAPEDLVEEAVKEYPVDGLVKEIERALFRG